MHQSTCEKSKWFGFDSVASPLIKLRASEELYTELISQIDFQLEGMGTIDFLQDSTSALSALETGPELFDFAIWNRRCYSTHSTSCTTILTSWFSLLTTRSSYSNVESKSEELEVASCRMEENRVKLKTVIKFWEWGTWWNKRKKKQKKTTLFRFD